MDRKTAARPTLAQRVGQLPEQPGVYLFRDRQGRVLYVGKALKLRHRVRSYLRLSPGTPHPVPRCGVGEGSAGGREATGRPARALGARTAQLMRHVVDVDVHTTSSEAEALLLEAQLIKAHQPHYNVAFRDDKAYPLLKVTNEPFPRLLVVRRKQADGAVYFGPYTDAGLMHEAVRFMRRVFPLRTCATFPKTPCLEYHLGQCLAPCANYIDAARYQRIVEDLIAFLQGKRDGLLRELSRRMQQAAARRQFEEAARLRDQIQALTSVIVAKEKSLAAGPLEQLQAALKLPRSPRRIEAFDISHIFGASAVGSMVVFTEGRPHRAHYRHFRIKTVQGIDDYRMMREVIRRRYGGSLTAQLSPPDLILIDGGKGQLSAACEELTALGLSIPTIGLAKRFEQIFLPGEREPIVLLPTSPVLHLLQHLRDEAHRFAVRYHRRLHGNALTTSLLHQVPGIGPRRAARLLARFGSVQRLQEAPPAEIARAVDIGQAKAEEILRVVARKVPHG